MKPAPDFSLLDQDGQTRSLNDYAGRWVVLYFYPRDNSLNCKREACSFRDEQRIISQFGNAAVVGVNKGSVDSHKRFSERNHLNFPLLSDPTHEVTKAYGAWRTNKADGFFDRAYATRRNTYLINPKGQIAKSYLGVVPQGHAETIIHDLQQLQVASATKVR
jgi:peroxiredoxin Q/BCP